MTSILRVRQGFSLKSSSVLTQNINPKSNHLRLRISTDFHTDVLKGTQINARKNLQQGNNECSPHQLFFNYISLNYFQSFQS